MPNLVWFRRDLRIADQKALHYAAKSSPDGVIGLYVITAGQWQSHDDSPAKIKFWLENLAALKAELDSLNIPMVVKMAADFSGCAKIVAEVAQAFECREVHFNAEYEVNEARRDQVVVSRCESVGLQVVVHDDRIIVPPTEIVTKEGRFYSVFTPYRRVWGTRAIEFCKVLPKPKVQPELQPRIPFGT